MKDELIIAFLKNELTPVERSEVENWIEHSDENKSSFERVKLIWNNSRNDFSNVDIDSGRAWDRIQTSIAQEELTGKKNPVRSARTYFRIAASILMLLGIGYLSFRLINNQVLSGKELITVQTTTDRSNIELPDGTHVWLNKNTRISYPEKFTPRLRELQVSGEAFFDVTENRRKPFVVSTESSKVKVLGTSFNVESVNQLDQVVVTVLSGKVSLSEMDDPENTLLIEPGERGTYNISGNRLSKNMNSNQNFLAWKTGILVFENASMEYVCATLSNHFEVSVIPDHQGSLDAKRLTATYDNKDLDEVLKILTLTLQISYELKDERFILFSSP